jgi:hypothetical protein
VAIDWDDLKAAPATIYSNKCETPTESPYISGQRQTLDALKFIQAQNAEVIGEMTKLNSLLYDLLTTFKELKR